MVDHELKIVDKIDRYMLVECSTNGQFHFANNDCKCSKYMPPPKRKSKRRKGGLSFGMVFSLSLVLSVRVCRILQGRLRWQSIDIITQT